MQAYHLHVQLGCIAQGLLQHLSINHTAKVWRCLLRTMNPAMPQSERIVASARRSTLPTFFTVPTFAPDLAKIIPEYRKHDPPSDHGRMLV